MLTQTKKKLDEFNLWWRNQWPSFKQYWSSCWEIILVTSNFNLAQLRRKQYATLHENCYVCLYWISLSTPLWRTLHNNCSWQFFRSGVKHPISRQRRKWSCSNYQFSKFGQQKRLVHHETHEKPFFSNADQLDNVFSPRNFEANRMVAVSALEWKRYPQQETTAFDVEEKGQAISYAQLIILVAQK